MGQESWRDIEGYEGMYQVSDKGNVRSLDRTVVSKLGIARRVSGRLLKTANVRGYECICLAKDGERPMFKVHRLVAKAFVPGCSDGMQVNHKDGDKTNNSAENLEWVTPLDNQLHAIRTGLKTGMEKAKPILRSDGVMFGSLKEAAQGSGCRIQDVCNVVKGRRKTSHGYSFSYAHGGNL